MINKIFNEDCFDVLNRLEDSSIDLILTSPPYCIGKAYDIHTTIEGFIEINEPIIKLACKKVKQGGSICWQVGYHVSKGEVIPLDFIVYEIFKRTCPEMKLRNRIVWHFEHGANCRNRFSGRNETVLWFTKGDKYYFDLDSVRVKQKYPGKKHYKGPKKGQYSGNPLGKNPGDVWIMPNVKANHIEKTAHPCQFPVGLAQRLIRSMCPPDGVVFDPFMGSGTTVATAALEGRSYIGSEIELEYFKIAQERLLLAQKQELPYRDADKPPMDPSLAGAVAKDPFI